MRRNEEVEEFGDDRDRAEECIDRLGRVRRSLKIHGISEEGTNGFGGSKRTSWKVGEKCFEFSKAKVVPE